MKTWKGHWFVVSAFLLIVFIAAYSKSGGSNSGATSTASVSLSGVVSVSYQPGSAIQTSLSTAGSATVLNLNFPADASSQAGDITLTPVALSNLPASLQSSKFVFKADPANVFIYAFSIASQDGHITSFNAPVTLSGTLSSTIPSGTTLNLAIYGNNTWVDVATATVGANGVFTENSPTPALPGILALGTYVLYKPAPAASNTGPIALNVPVSGSGGFNYTQGTYLGGFEFKANSAISITKLGAYDSNYSALPNGAETFAPVSVGLYDLTTHTLLGSATVQASDPVTGVFHYAALASPIALNTTDNYAIVSVTSTNHYIASPSLTMADVNSAITYVAFAGYGAGGLTQTGVLVEPDFFYDAATHGLNALNYDIVSNFMFVGN